MFEDLLLNSTDTFTKLILQIDVLHTIPNAYFKYLQFLPLFVIAILTTLILTPLIGQLAIKYRIFDLPQDLRDSKSTLNQYDDPNRHIHKEPIPFLGGLAVVLPLIVIILIFLKITPTILPILIGLSIIAIVGFLDDKYNLPATYQLIAQLLASFIIVLSPIDITFINNPFNGYFHLDALTYSFNLGSFPLSLVLPGDILIIPWIILCINALKWVGGSDGLIETNSIIAFALMFVLGVRNESSVIATISIVTSGLILGMLYYNFPPAKIFTGSIGKTAYGFLIATLALVNGAKLATTIIILALPLIDALITVTTRYLKFKPKNPIELLRINDKSHLHHQLLELGLSSKQILLVETSIALVVGALAIFTTGANKLVALVLALGIVAMLISFIRIRTAQKKKEVPKVIEEEESPESKYTY